MRRHGADPRRAAADLKGWLWRATFVGVLLMLFGTTSWLLVNAREGERATVKSSRTSWEMDATWLLVAEGQNVVDVIARMGPPDREEEELKRIPNCPGPCDTPCESFHTCVRRYEWASAPEPESASIYSVCADAAGVIRSTSTGMRFNLRSVDPWYGPGDVVGWTVAGIVFGAPLAGLLLLKRRLWPPRLTSLGLRK